MTADNQSARFEEAVLPHLDAAFNLARWLVRNSTDAQDLVQEAYLRAWEGFAGFHGGDATPKKPLGRRAKDSTSGFGLGTA